MFSFRPPTRRLEETAPGIFRDMYGTCWDRTIDKDVGVACGPALKTPTLAGFHFPECAGGEEELRTSIAVQRNVALQFSLAFSMFERAWAQRGMENLLLDFVERLSFMHELFDELVDMGVNLFNPFQPEVMDILAVRAKHHGRLAFYGGLSIQRTLRFGSSAHVPVENIPTVFAAFRNQQVHKG